LIAEFFEPYMVFGASSSCALGLLPQVCEGLDPSLPVRLISGVGDVDSVPPSEAIWELGRMVDASETLTAAFDRGVDGLLHRLRELDEATGFLSALDDVRRIHGARGPIEWDSASPSWETSPDLILALVDRLRFVGDDLSPASRLTRVAADREAAVAEVRQHLAGNDEALATLDHALHLAGRYVPARERTKLTEMMAVHEVRVVTDALGRRMTGRGILAAPEQVNMPTDTELDAFVAGPASFADTIRQRSNRFTELAAQQEPFIIYAEQPDPEGRPPRTTDTEPVTIGEMLQGVPGGPAKVVGRARVVHGGTGRVTVLETA
jgi:pyruvate,water dikinase